MPTIRLHEQSHEAWECLRQDDQESLPSPTLSQDRSAVPENFPDQKLQQRDQLPARTSQLDRDTSECLSAKCWNAKGPGLHLRWPAHLTPWKGIRCRRESPFQHSGLRDRNPLLTETHSLQLFDRKVVQPQRSKNRAGITAAS